MAGISRSSRLKEKHRKSSTLSLGNEGSAARTRPLSLEEIMLRRKNKEFPENVKDKVNEAWNISSRGSVENNVDHFESGTGYRHDKSLRSIVEKLVPDEQVNMSSIRKEENTSMKEDNLVEGKDKGTLRSEVNLKTKWNTDVRRMAREDKADKEMRGRRKKDGHLSDEYEYKADKKHSRDYNNMDRYSNRDTGNSEMEIKKRHQNVDDLNPGEGNTERKHEKHRHSRRKSNERQSDEFDCEAEKKHERDSYANRHRGRSERELKKRYQNVDDKKRGEGNAEKKHEKHRHNRRIGNELTSDDSEREAEKRHSRNSAGKHGYTDRSRENSEIEGKRKYQNGDDDRTRDRNAAKKHDMGKFHGLEKSERKERQEDKSERKERQEEKLERKSHYEESRAKRTLRSPEHEDRNKRSPSLSPRPHKRAYHGAEHEVLPPLSLEDRPRKQHSDLDRSRVSTNGSSSYHRRYGRSASGLGGYSPRKRRTEAAVRTPSPSNHSPEKKSAAWDLPPAGTESVFSAAVLSNFQLSNPTTVSSNTNELVSVAPVDSPPVKPSPLPSISSSSIRSIAPIDSVQLTQATRPMRRLYLENVPSSASEKAIIDCLNDFLLSASVNHFQGVNPCISCIINKEKGQALVEFLTPEDASAALSFDASTLCGSIVRIRRPKDYVEVATTEPERSVDAVVSISDIVEDSPDKIFIGGISKDLSSEMLIEVASTFGSLKAYHFEVNDTNGSSFAFVEYVDHSVTLKACAGLNGLKLAGEVLIVVQAMPHFSLSDNGDDKPCYAIPEHAKPLLKQPSQVLKLNNVFTIDVLSSLSDSEIEEVLEDVRLECARFGTVKSINVVKHGDGENNRSKSEAHEVINNVGSKGAPQNSGYDNNDAGSGSLDETRGVSGVGFPCIKEGDVVEDDSCQTAQLVSNVEVDIVHDHHSTLELQSDIVRDTIELSAENKSAAGDELSSKEADHKSQEDFSAVDGRVGTESTNIADDINEEQEGKHEYIFEPGSVLVEYGRTEASRMAAHCLHGRLFDDRMVTVEYVALDLYREMFTK